MKEWASNHPKASLLARKRAAILEAARSTFLSAGYEGATMEAIAVVAGVSTMTLYRHARTKDALFAAVMLNECARAHADEHSVGLLLDQPLRHVCIQVGVRFQERLATPDTVSLFRTVMMETARFPHVAEAAYDGFIGAWKRDIETFISGTVEFGHVPASDLCGIVQRYVDDLLGTEVLRALFGFTIETDAGSRMQRAEVAADRLLAALPR